MTSSSTRAVVLVSGGLDSATTLAMARSQGLQCHALSVDYGQRHRAELDAAARVAMALGAVEHRVIRVDLGGIGGSALTDASIAVPESPQSGIPITYVPARNTVMLALAPQRVRREAIAPPTHPPDGDAIAALVFDRGVSFPWRSDDPRLTAYVLGELSAEEAAEVAAVVASVFVAVMVFPP